MENDIVDLNVLFLNLSNIYFKFYSQSLPTNALSKVSPTTIERNSFLATNTMDLLQEFDRMAYS